jgi:hypothetical protein
MAKLRDTAAWAALGVAAAALTAWLLPRLHPALPDDWQISRGEAKALALERLRDLGEPVADPYVVTSLVFRPTLEQRLRRAELAAGAGAGADDPWSSRLAREVLEWQVKVYPPGARSRAWTYGGAVTPDGEVAGLRLQVEQEQGEGSVDPETARRRAEEFLVRQEFDLSRYGEPEVRREDLGHRTDTTVRYRDRERALGEEVGYGVEVAFAGDRLAGFNTWIDDPQERVLQQQRQPVILLGTARFLVNYLLFPIVAVFFLRRYHAGEVGVKRAVQIFALVFATGTLLIAMSARSATENFGFGPLSRAQVTWAWGLQLVILFFAAIAAIAALSWSVGESLCRERWGGKLAAFDALFLGRWNNATFARSALRGPAAGCVLVAVSLVLAWLFARRGALLSASDLFGPWWESAAWPGVALVLFAVPFALYGELFGRLLLVPAAVRAMGRWLGPLAVVAIGAVVLGPVLAAQSATWDLVLSLVSGGFLVWLFLRYDLLTAVLASATALVLPRALPLVAAEDPMLQLQGGLALLAVAVPLLASVRHLAGGEELAYRYEDVPPHVRRIAERERQRVELETARRIQSSILPELPPSLHGVEIAHAYLPATEVGGDFYDVLALEDGRLALAVGDVAGHGVSSGLVMSMARSALAVQVTFDPEVASVFRTMNRMVYQTARKRLLTTLSYGLLDPVRRQLYFGSAGHLFPYRIGADGRVDALESVAYPLGVRDPLPVRVEGVPLAAGDTLFFFSDGVVEARRDGSDELYGFDRLEDSLRRHAAGGPAALRDGVLADLERFTAGAPREDDQTILVLRLPS